MRVLHLDEIEGIPVFGTLVWKPVRKTLGVTAFGINAYTAANAGDEVVEDLDDVTQKRQAVANEPGTTVLAIGGVPGKHDVSAWEYFFPALAPMRDGDYETARRLLEEGLVEKDAPVLHYQLACVEALSGNRDRALDELTLSAGGSENLREHAQTDADLASIRDDPRFPTS